MHDAVRANWHRFNNPLEGRVNYMYLDVKGWVSTGLGNKIDQTERELSPPTAEERDASLALAREFAWTVDVDGPPATPDEVAADWDAVKSHLELAPLGHPAIKEYTRLRITDDEMDRFVDVGVDRMEDFLLGRPEFAAFESWPASAQLGTLSMAWAMGPRFRFPNFQAFVAAEDWAGAATECHFNPDIGTIVYRNKLDRLHFENAALAAAQGLPIENLSITLVSILGVQHALWMLGIDPGPQDGGDGGRTQAGVTAYQESRGIAPNGAWDDPDTQAQLAADLAAAGWNVV